MAVWGEKYDDEGLEVPQRYWHSTCGNETHAIIVCSKCGQPISAHNIATEFLTPEAIAVLNDLNIDHSVAHRINGLRLVMPNVSNRRRLCPIR